MIKSLLDLIAALQYPKGAYRDAVDGYERGVHSIFNYSTSTFCSEKWRLKLYAITSFGGLLLFL